MKDFEGTLLAEVELWRNMVTGSSAPAHGDVKRLVPDDPHPGTCDWGFCDGTATCWRWDGEWLACCDVCSAKGPSDHGAADDDG